MASRPSRDLGRRTDEEDEEDSRRDFVDDARETGEDVPLVDWAGTVWIRDPVLLMVAAKGADPEDAAEVRGIVAELDILNFKAKQQ